MYGIVNQAIQGMVIESYGKDIWDQIKQKSGVDVEYFISSEPYDDEITFELVASASTIIGIDSSEVLKSFGRYWVLKTGKEKYGDLMRAGGADFFEFIQNLPNFHGRIMLIYPKLSPPEFKVEKLSDNTLKLYYYSSRKGLTDFVVGLLDGLAEMFDTKINVELIDTDHEEVWKDTFLIQILVP